MSSPSQLFSCVDSAAILKSPINNSTAKSQYSFRRAKRFPDHRSYCDQIYNLPDSKSVRKTMFGYGHKNGTDRNVRNDSPSPDHYLINSFVQVNKMHCRGSSCHIGRKETAPLSYIPLDRLKFPGAGEHNEFRYNDTPKWTMRPHVNRRVSQRSKMSPGPGSYDFSQSLNPQGKYFACKYKNSGSKVWNPKESVRFYKSTTDTPGSGTYNPAFNELSDSGKYVLSKFKGDGRRLFNQTSRDSFVHQPAKKTDTPGPGSYRQPSDFGQYDIINKQSRLSSK